VKRGRPEMTHCGDGKNAKENTRNEPKNNEKTHQTFRKKEQVPKEGLCWFSFVPELQGEMAMGEG